MSLVSALERVAQLATLHAQLAQRGSAAASATSADFTAALESAQASPAPATTTAPASTGTGSGTLATDTRYAAEIEAAATKYGVDPALVRAVIQVESGFNPTALSSAGAQGLMQLMPATARGLGVTNSFDPAQNIDGGTRYLRGQLDRFGGDVRLALAAYNAGPGAVAEYGGVPPYAETQRYVEKVLGIYAPGGATP